MLHRETPAIPGPWRECPLPLSSGETRWSELWCLQRPDISVGPFGSTTLCPGSPRFRAATALEIEQHGACVRPLLHRRSIWGVQAATARPQITVRLRSGSGETERGALLGPVERETGVLEELRRVDCWRMPSIENGRDDVGREEGQAE